MSLSNKELVKEPNESSIADGSILLAMRNITKRFGGVVALKDVSFSCRQGKVHALVGENGAGKSTLIKILAGAYRADAGQILFRGQSHVRLSARQALDLGIRIIYQELNLIPGMTVAENIFLGHEPQIGRWGLIDGATTRRKAAEILKRLGVELHLDAQVEDLPVASQQMVEIAKALSEEADLIVMDEPSAILAGYELDRLFAMIQLLVEQGVTVVYISHRLDEIFEIAHEVTVLKDGEVVGSFPIDKVTRGSLIRMMVGREMTEVFPTGHVASDEVVLTARNVTTEALPHPLDIQLHKGEILGLAGMVGSGRTELARALFGADPLQSGTVAIADQQLRHHTPQKAIESGIAFVPEDRKVEGLLIDQSIRMNLTLPILSNLTRWGFIQRRKERELIDKAQSALTIRMAGPEQLAQFLSGGNQQKVVLAKWLETAPAVIILDEPTRGIDVGAKFEIYQLMRNLADRGLAILLISSELPELLGMSNRIVVMRDRRIVGEMSGDLATEESILTLATTENNGVRTQAHLHEHDRV